MPMAAPTMITELGKLDAKLVFAVLGPLFLLLAILRSAAAGRLAPQARVWLLIGVIFSAVAAWLYWTQPLIAIARLAGVGR